VRIPRCAEIAFIAQKLLQQQLESHNLSIHLADALVLLGYYLGNLTTHILRWSVIGVQIELERRVHLEKRRSQMTTSILKTGLPLNLWEIPQTSR
jgi:hypothetical protein